MFDESTWFNMPYSKQHLNEKARIAKKNSRQHYLCPCTICRFERPHSENVIKRHLETFGSFDGDRIESGSDDEESELINFDLNCKHNEHGGKELHDTSSSPDTDETERKRRRTQESSGGCLMLEGNDQVTQVSDNFNCTSTSDSTESNINLDLASEKCDRYSSEAESSSPIRVVENNDLPSSSESSSAVDNSSSESDDSTIDTHREQLTDSDVYSSEKANILLFQNSEFTVLQALAGYFQWFTEHPSISKSALSGMLRLKKRLLPQPNNLPATYEEACNFVKPFLLPFETYHVCPNDCVLFRKTSRYDYSKLEACPVCGTKRYSVNKKPRRAFIYYPLGPRWRRMYGSASISEVLQSHHYHQEEKKVMHDIHDSPSWKKAFSEGK